MSKARPQKLKTENDTGEDQSITTPVPEGTSPDLLPFPEWADADINLEKWDSNVAAAKDKTVPTQPKVLFEDPQQVHLPASVKAYEWKRCSEIFPDVNFVICPSKPSYPDLVTPNQHLIHSEFYRSFISSIETLLYIGCNKTFPEEYGSPAYYAPTDRAWRPWFHIYSNCKVVKGHSEHTALYNSSGKYAVRLYWMGVWRKIYVDDFIPVDTSYCLLLPSLHIPKSKSELELIKEESPVKKKGKGPATKKEIIEIWPMILCKALLKLRGLSSVPKHELKDFDIIHCLTGWVPQIIRTKEISTSDLWDIFMAYVERFEWPEQKEGSGKRTGSSKSKSKETAKSDPTGKKGGKGGSRGAGPSGIGNMKDGDRYIVVSCNNFTTLLKNDGRFQTTNYNIFISQVRVIPFVKPAPRPELEFWKKFRYEEWAVEQGIISPDIPKLNIKSLKIVEPFKRISTSLKEIDNVESRLQETLGSEKTEKKSEKSSKSSKPKVKLPKNHLEPDPSMWIDFAEIQSNIDTITIYFQPRSFKSKTKISDINFSNKTNDFKHVVSCHDLKETRNEPVYMFTDSIDYKMLLINLAQTGNVARLEKKEDEVCEPSKADSYQDLDMCVELVLRKTEVIDCQPDPSLKINRKSRSMSLADTKLISFVLEEYNWDTNASGEARTTIQTVGNKSVLLDLKPGRKSFRLWISSHCSYVLQVFSDTPVTIGCLEEYLIACTSESQLLTNLCFELSSCFGKLVQSFGMPDHLISLRNFYHCYKPINNLNKKELVTVHQALFDEFSKIIVGFCSLSNAMECIRLLFYQLKTFDYINPYLEEPHLCAEVFQEKCQVDYAKKMQRASVKIQAFFKGIYIRRLLKKMNENHKQYYGIFDTLKKVYNEIFASDKRLTFCPHLLRNLFERKDMETLKYKFEIFHDIRTVLDTYILNNVMFITEFSWVPICRCEFHINSIDAITVKTNLFCSLASFYVRVFDNDTGLEIKRYTNNVAVMQYESNVGGYTVLCYSWAEENTKLAWKLILATKRISRNDLVIIPNVLTATVSLRDLYMPNYNNIICRYFIRVNADTCVTAHLRTSYDQVKISLRLIDANKKTISMTDGVGSALLPVLYLKYTEDLVNVFQKKISKKRLSSFQSNVSEITYSKLTGRSGSLENESLRSGSTHMRGSEGSSDSRTKRHRRRTGSDGVEGEDMLSQPSDRSLDGDGKPRARKSKSQSESSEGENVSEKRKSSLKSKSFDRLSQRSNQGKSRSSGGSRQATLNRVVERQTEYILEGQVVEDSWPLTGEEWFRVQQLREKGYLNLLQEKKPSMTKKPSTPTKLEEPYWVLDLVHSPDDSLEVVRDCSKAEKMKEVKTKWFADIERYKWGTELRDSYLLDYLEENDNLIIDRSLVRSNDPKDFIEIIVKEPSYEEFILEPSKEIDEDTCKTKTEEDYFIEEMNMEQTLKAYRNDKIAAEQDNKELLENQKNNFRLASKWFLNIRNDSVQMMENAIQVEKDYAKKVLDLGAKGEKKGKKKKKK